MYFFILITIKKSSVQFVYLNNAIFISVHKQELIIKVVWQVLQIKSIHTTNIIGHQKCVLCTETEHLPDRTHKAVFTVHKRHLRMKLTDV